MLKAANTQENVLWSNFRDPNLPLKQYLQQLYFQINFWINQKFFGDSRHSQIKLFYLGVYKPFILLDFRTNKFNSLTAAFITLR